MADTNSNSMEPVVGLLQDLLFVQLALSRVDNHSIRKIACVQMSKVTRISNTLKKGRRGRGVDNG
jgi:hypothetical protein